MSQAAALHLLIRLTPAQVGGFGVTTDRSQAAVAEGFGGEPGITHRLLGQGPEGVAELMGVKRRDAELAGEVATYVLGTGGGQPVGAGGLAGRFRSR